MNKVVLEVLNRLENNGYAAYVVGGYPRDFYLGIETDDYDICTSATPEEIKLLFHGTTNYSTTFINYKGLDFEITTFRVDREYRGVREPIIIFTNKLEEDLKRRDFTINTICINRNGDYVDLLGGKKDIDSRIIRCVGDPDIKMSEDPLRILRAIRFATILDFFIDDELSSSIRKHGYLIENLSKFRKKGELDKIFSSKNAQRGIELLKDYGLDTYLNINLNDVTPVRSYLGIWAQLNSDYEFIKEERKQLEIISSLLPIPIGRKELYYYGVDICSIVIQIQKKNDDAEALYNELPIKNRKDINIGPDDIINNSKVLIEKTYLLIEEEILNGELENNRKSIIEFIKKI